MFSLYKSNFSYTKTLYPIQKQVFQDKSAQMLPQFCHFFHFLFLFFLFFPVFQYFNGLFYCFNGLFIVFYKNLQENISKYDFYWILWFLQIPIKYIRKKWIFEVFIKSYSKLWIFMNIYQILRSDAVFGFSWAFSTICAKNQLRRTNLSHFPGSFLIS